MLLAAATAVVLLVAVLLAVIISQPAPSWSLEDDVLPVWKHGAITTVVVTGATSGIGKAVTKLLTRPELGVHVVAIGRSKSRLEKLQEEVGADKLTPFVACFTDLDEVDRVGREIAAKFDRIDVLVNNAGIHNGFDIFEAKTTKQGYDLVFGVNYLSHVLLTERLIPVMKSSPNPKVVQVSSSFHWAVDGSDLSVVDGRDSAPLASRPGGHHGWMFFRSQRQYANSKFAQILHARSLRKRIPAVSICPTWVATQIVATSDSWFFSAFQKIAFPSDGYGISSLMMGITNDTLGDGDYISNLPSASKIFHVVVGDRPSWMSNVVPIRDGITFLGAMILLLTEKFVGKGPDTVQSSPATYDTELQDGLDRWSREVALKAWLGNNS